MNKLDKYVILEYYECIEYCKQICREEDIGFLGNCKKGCEEYLKSIDKNYGNLITTVFHRK